MKFLSSVKYYRKKFCFDPKSLLSLEPVSSFLGCVYVQGPIIADIWCLSNKSLSGPEWTLGNESGISPLY